MNVNELISPGFHKTISQGTPASPHNIVCPNGVMSRVDIDEKDSSALRRAAHSSANGLHQTFLDVRIAHALLQNSRMLTGDRPWWSGTVVDILEAAVTNVKGSMLQFVESQRFCNPHQPMKLTTNNAEV